MKFKRNKRSRLRGLRTCGYGSRKKHRGKGSTAGCGMAGTGKKSGQKKIWVVKYAPDWLGRKKGFLSVPQKHNKKLPAINLGEIEKRMPEFEKKGLLKGKELNLKGFKILSSGTIKEKLAITASAFSENAKKKITASGGSFVIVGEQ